jgi:hypothetical protein
MPLCRPILPCRRDHSGMSCVCRPFWVMAMLPELVTVCCMASVMSESASRGKCVLTWQLGGGNEKVTSESASRWKCVLTGQLGGWGKQACIRLVPSLALVISLPSQCEVRMQVLNVMCDVNTSQTIRRLTLAPPAANLLFTSAVLSASDACDDLTWALLPLQLLARMQTCRPHAAFSTKFPKVNSVRYQSGTNRTRRKRPRRFAHIVALLAHTHITAMVYCIVCASQR